MEITARDKKIISAALLSAFLLAGLVYADNLRNDRFDDYAIEQAKTEAADKVCAQVITRARSPKTGTAFTFSTPCEVPSNWEKIK